MYNDMTTVHATACEKCSHYSSCGFAGTMCSGFESAECSRELAERNEYRGAWFQYLESFEADNGSLNF